MTLFDLVATITLDSSEYEAGIKRVSSASEGLGKLNSGINKILSVGAVAAGAAVAGMTAFAKSSIQAGSQFDSAISQVAATMGTTVDQIGELRDFAIEMGSKTAFSASEAAEALNYMALAGYDAETSMSMLPTVLDLAAAGGVDLARASDMVTDAQSALGLSVEEAATMVDQMAAASSASNTSVEQLGEAFLTIGATARNLSGGTEELATVLGVLADNGIKGAEGGTHLRNIILSLQNPTDEAAAALDSLGVSVYDSDGNMRSMIDVIGDLQNGLGDMDQASKDAIVSGIFNKADLASVNALLGTSADRFDELTGKIEDSAGAAERMAETQLDNLAGDITLMQSAAEGAKIAFSNGLTPAIRTVAQTITKFLSRNSTQKALNDLGNKIGEITKTITGKLLNALPRLMKLFEDGGQKIKLFTAAFAALVIAIKATVNPVGALITALGLLAAGAAAAALTADELTKKYNSLTDEQYENIQSTLDAIDAYNEMQKSREETYKSIDAETKRTKDLWAELQTLVDEQGNVVEGNEDHVRSIVEVLNEMGIEVELVDGQIQKYGELSESIDEVIEKKRAMAKLEAAEQEYNAARDNIDKYSESIHDLGDQIEATLEQIGAWENEISDLSKETFASSRTFGNQEERTIIQERIDEAKTALAEYQLQLDTAMDAERNAYATMSEYLSAYASAEEGNWEQVNQILDKNSQERARHLIESGRVTAQELALLDRNARILMDKSDRYAQELSQGTMGYTEEGLAQLQEQTLEAVQLLAEASEQMSDSGEEGGEGWAEGIGSADGAGEADKAAKSAGSVLAAFINEAAKYGGQAGTEWARNFNQNAKVQEPQMSTSEPESHNAIGLDFVPYNNYTAALHRGEAVLTAREAENWRRGGERGIVADPNVAVIVDLLEQIVANGLNANIDSRSVFRAVREENMLNSRATRYNALAMT